jgi:aspartate carbamoyltransferase catalytic subunit
MSSVQNLKSSKAAVKPEEAMGEWRQAGDLVSGMMARIQKERLRQSALVASTANDHGASPERLAS